MGVIFIQLRHDCGKNFYYSFDNDKILKRRILLNWSRLISTTDEDDCK